MAFDIDELLSKDKKTIKQTDTKKEVKTETVVAVEEPKKEEVVKPKSSKMGRPKKEIKADERIVCYLTKEENEKFELIADEEVTSKSALARKILVQYLKSK